MVIFAQRIECNCIDFELVPIPQADPEFADFKYQVQVKMDLSVSNVKDDTLVLKTNIKAAQGPMVKDRL